MRLILKLGDKAIDAVIIPTGMENNQAYINSMIKVLLDRNEPIIRISSKTPECSMEIDKNEPTPFLSSIPPHQQSSTN